MPFRAALSGLNAAAAELRVIGNNIANSATTGFKESRTQFSDVFAASSLGVSANSVGGGVSVSAVSQQFTQGNIEFTDNNLDLAISGQGFFILNDGGTTSYTRAGQFSVDREGFVVSSTGSRLTIFEADNTGAITGAQGDLQLDTSDIAPQATTSIDLGINLDAAATVPTIAFDATSASSYNSSTSLTVFDSLGTSHLATTYYVKTADNTWDSYIYIDGVDAGGGSAQLTFSPQGTILLPSPATVSVAGFTPSGGAANFNLTLDYADATQFGAGFSVNSLVQDGFATGRLSAVDISDNGTITSQFTNGQSRTLGQIALANFGNPQGLRQLGDSSWAESFDSGSALVGDPGSGSLGLIQSGALEGSNVDITEQLVQMITTQRNFQANSQVISTADTIIQTIINIR